MLDLVQIVGMADSYAYLPLRDLGGRSNLDDCARLC